MAERVTLGKTGLKVSPICYGSWQASRTYWGDQPDETLIAAMRRAVEIGVNFFDTADAYGDGRSEELVGKALEPFPREELVVATKVFHHFYEDGHRHPDLSKSYIFEACENSLRRMNMDYIDLYQCHQHTPIAHPAEIVEAMETLKRQGKIRHYGLSNQTEPQLRMMLAAGNFETLQPRYSLIDTDLEADVLPTCLAENIGVLVYSPLARGVLAGKYKGDETFDDNRAKMDRYQGEAFKALCEKVRSLEAMASDHGLTIIQLVLAATLMHPAIHSAIVGIKRPEQIEEAAGAMGKTFSIEEYWQIRNTLK